MASFRINYNPATIPGGWINNAARAIANARDQIVEAHNKLEAYGDNNVQLAADAGMGSDSVAANTAAVVRSLFNQAVGELLTTTIQDIPINTQTASRQIADQAGN